MLSQPQTSPPVETGDRLATFPRFGRDGARQELRVNLAEFNGYPYISLRRWDLDARSNIWLPSSKCGISIRLSEAAGVIEAISEALRRVEQNQPVVAQG